MASIPAISDFTNSSVTEGEFKTALSGLHDYLTGQLGTAGTQAAAQAALGAILGAGVATRTTGYTVIASDRGKTISCDGTFTLTLTAATTLGAGFAFSVANTGTGTITIDPNASETINGSIAYTMPGNTTAIFLCTGLSWVTMSGSPFASVTGSPDSTKFLRGDLSWSAPTDALTQNAGASVGAVGTYAFAVHTNTNSYSPGATISGANLKYSGVSSYEVTNTGTLSGTWRCMGYGARINLDIYGYVNFATLWLRIA